MSKYSFNDFNYYFKDYKAHLVKKSDQHILDIISSVKLVPLEIIYSALGWELEPNVQRFGFGMVKEDANDMDVESVRLNYISCLVLKKAQCRRRNSTTSSYIIDYMNTKAERNEGAEALMLAITLPLMKKYDNDAIVATTMITSDAVFRQFHFEDTTRDYKTRELTAKPYCSNFPCIGVFFSYSLKKIEDIYEIASRILQDHGMEGHDEDYVEADDDTDANIQKYAESKGYMYIPQSKEYWREQMLQSLREQGLEPSMEENYEGEISQEDISEIMEPSSRVEVDTNNANVMNDGYINFEKLNSLRREGIQPLYGENEEVEVSKEDMELAKQNMLSDRNREKQKEEDEMRLRHKREIEELIQEYPKEYEELMKKASEISGNANVTFEEAIEIMSRNFVIGGAKGKKKGKKKTKKRVVMRSKGKTKKFTVSQVKRMMNNVIAKMKDQLKRNDKKIPTPPETSSTGRLIENLLDEDDEELVNRLNLEDFIIKAKKMLDRQNEEIMNLTLRGGKHIKTRRRRKRIVQKHTRRH